MIATLDIAPFEGQYQTVEGNQTATIENTVSTQEAAEKHLRALRYWRSQTEQIEAHAQAELERIELWKQTQLDKIAPRIHFHESGLVAFMHNTGKKTLNLINGTLKRIAGRDRVEVQDAELFTRWAKSSPQTQSLLRIKAEPDKAAIMDHIKSTGEMPEGIDLKTGEDTFKIVTE